ncbi:MAG: ABC transporter permease [Bacteroidales bacterium]|nr:ABC transporter permease [Bacteroidales bacterium]MCM1416935.1 ABC transporter permease [bacterium]MCM1424628.1 ABC transporter permease [bacterium]
MKTLQLEFYKIRRRRVWLSMFAMLGVQILWGMWSMRNPKDWELASGWMSLLYELTILDGIMMPTILSVLASRLADIEHKGNTYKQLKTLRPSGSLYHAKALCGAIIIAVLLAMQAAVFILFGCFLGYEGTPDLSRYLTAYGLKFAADLSLFLLQLLLSMLFANQMIPLVAGLGGSMFSLLVMYVARYSFLPWGGSLSACIVGMDWDETTRIITYYYREYTSAEIASVVCIFVWIVVFYAAGRILFTHREA